VASYSDLAAVAGTEMGQRKRSQLTRPFDERLEALSTAVSYGADGSRFGFLRLTAPS